MEDEKKYTKGKIIEEILDKTPVVVSPFSCLVGFMLLLKFVLLRF